MPVLVAVREAVLGNLVQSSNVVASVDHPETSPGSWLRVFTGSLAPRPALTLWRGGVLSRLPLTLPFPSMDNPRSGTTLPSMHLSTSRARTQPTAAHSGVLRHRSFRWCSGVSNYVLCVYIPVCLSRLSRGIFPVHSDLLSVYFPFESPVYDLCFVPFLLRFCLILLFW